MIFKSLNPSLDIPTDLTIWDWLFDPYSEYSPLVRFPASETAGYTNASTKERVSYAQVKEYATYFSTALVKMFGFKEEDTVALFSENTIWYPVAMLGTVRVGGVISGASPAYNVEEMTYALKTAQAKILMTLPSSMEVAVQAAKNAGIPQDRIFLLEGNVEGYTTMQQLIDIGRSYGQEGQVKPFKIPPEKKNKDVCAFLSFSSGTTGLPKAVMIAHQNVIAQCLQVKQVTPENHKRILAVLPLFHIHQLHLPILLNAEVYMLPAFNMESMLEAITTFKIPEILLVPPIIIRLIRDPIVSKYDLSHVRRFSSGAAPLSKEMLKLLQEKFPGTGFKQGYGMTESCSCITAHPPEKMGYEYAFRVGTVVANTEVKIIDIDSGAELGYDQPGEILARGPQIVMGYLNNPKATRETFDEDGWLHTGDVGKMDKEGFITITDRIKEMIKVKGIGVAPAELEGSLLGHPDVEDAAVLAIPDDYSGEKPKAYVVLKSGRQSEAAEVGKRLIKFIKENKVRHKWLAEVEITDVIPKSASGKILRRVLRDMQRNGTNKGLVVRDEKAKFRDDDRRVVLDAEIVEKIEASGNFCIIPPKGLLDRFLATLREETETARREHQQVLVLVFGHGEEGSVGITIGGSGCALAAPRLTRQQFSAVVGPGVDVTLLTTSCFLGGWVIRPLAGEFFLSSMTKFNITEMTAEEEEEEMSRAWANSLSRGRGSSVFITAVFSELIRASGAMYNPFSNDHVISFAAQDDKWDSEWRARSGFPLLDYKKRWEELRELLGPTGSIGRGYHNLVKAKARLYLESFPGPSNASGNMVFHLRLIELLRGKRFDEDSLVRLNDTLDYRLSAMQLATQYVSFLDISFVDRLLFDTESWKNAADSSADTVTKAHTYNTVLDYVLDAKLFDVPLRTQGWAHLKPKEYLAIALVESGLGAKQIREGIARLKTLKTGAQHFLIQTPLGKAMMNDEKVVRHCDEFNETVEKFRNSPEILIAQ
ncbi:hypothetical protein AJ80_07602 [Polytolypa hystricis UAMH7299]|uniref:Acetyl-CoA synthetase-like protein n=1 Tax=Polytolypa hystricis (strain UAMH7299) TaxID=1447883 RepID=A0A2B7XML4_POLH7|nr:hypothetical protein AJ80_07602 [Polytolypa hystricis UAMH7299]